MTEIAEISESRQEHQHVASRADNSDFYRDLLAAIIVGNLVSHTTSLEIVEYDSPYCVGLESGNSVLEIQLG